MKLSAACGLLPDLWEAMKIAFVPSLKRLLSEPSLILQPHALSQIFMANVWEGGMAAATDEGGRPVKEKLITPNAYGVVLDVGAGLGHTIRYLDRSCVTKYVAVEPNTLMHPRIREAANAASFYESDGTLLILSCGAEDSLPILSALSSSSTTSPDAAPQAQVDCIISILVLCSIPEPERVVKSLVRDVLKPGGQFLFYEHVLSHQEDVAWWQRFWTPMWKRAFDGCRLDRPTHLVVKDVKLGAAASDGRARGEEGSAWKEMELSGKPGEPEEHLFWHQVGRFVKK